MLVRNVAVLAFLRQQWRLHRAEPGIWPIIDGEDIPSQGHGESGRDERGADPTPIAPIPFAPVDLSQSVNPLHGLTESPKFALTDRFFDQTGAISRSLVSVRAQALIYTLIRNLRPEHVIEIGTYQAGTSEAICRALHANGFGRLHTVDPFATRELMGILAQWPVALREHLRLYAMDSMAFYARFEIWPAQRVPLVFVDGNHDYEYATFDIQCAARIIAAGGFILVDNIAQPGPYLAARDFLAAHPGWTECAMVEYRYDLAAPFDRARCGIPGTELMILRAPQAHVIGDRPVGFPGTVLLGNRAPRAIEVVPSGDLGAGILHAQCIARGFSSGQKPVEAFGSASRAMSAEQGGRRVEIPVKIDLDAAAFEHVRTEIWLSWSGEGPLSLTSTPKILD
jgi:predicted O-methyltransferase YrrM